MHLLLFYENTPISHAFSAHYQELKIPHSSLLAPYVDANTEARMEETIEAKLDTLNTPEQPFTSIIHLIPMLKTETHSSLFEISPSQWERASDYSFLQAFFYCKNILNYALSNKQILSFTHILSIHNNSALSDILIDSWYAFSRSIAKEYGRKGFRSNLVLLPENKATNPNWIPECIFLSTQESAFITGEILRF